MRLLFFTIPTLNWLSINGNIDVITLFADHYQWSYFDPYKWPLNKVWVTPLATSYQWNY